MSPPFWPALETRYTEPPRNEGMVRENGLAFPAIMVADPPAPFVDDPTIIEMAPLSPLDEEPEKMCTSDAKPCAEVPASKLTPPPALSEVEATNVKRKEKYRV